MTHAIQLPAIILPEDHRGVWISHALAWILFVSIPVVMASPAFAYMSMYVWLAQFLVLTLRSVIVFYLMYMVVVPALHSRGGLPYFAVLFTAVIAFCSFGTAIIDTVFIRATSIVPTPVNGELSISQMTQIWAITYGMLGFIALAGRITFDWFTVARSWYRESLAQADMQSTGNAADKVIHARSMGEPAQIWVRSSGEDVKLTVSDIWYIESMKDYVAYQGAFGRVMVYQRLKDASAELEPHGFKRIHRSFVVNEEHIAKRSASAVVVAGKELPVGRTYRC
jgi:hypothetical protein